MTNPNHQATDGGAAEEAAPGSLARSLPLWVGKTPDEKVPPRVRARVFEREGGRCWLSGRKILAGDLWELDHKVALINGGRHAEDNLAPALKDKHREKTAEDVKLKAKLYRIRAKHTGAWPPSKQKIRSRGFQRRAPDTMGEKV